MKKHLVRISTGLTLALFGASNAFASVPDIRPTDAGSSSSSLGESIGSIVETVLNFVFYGIGLVALLYLVWAGYKYITAGGDVKKAGEARQAILNAIIGIAIVVAAYAIINFAFNLGGAATEAVSGDSVNFK